MVKRVVLSGEQYLLTRGLGVYGLDTAVLDGAITQDQVLHFFNQLVSLVVLGLHQGPLFPSSDLVLVLGKSVELEFGFHKVVSIHTHYDV